MLVVLKHAKKVITDSGGLQKEAYWSKKPCITLRNETEWTETLTNNWNILTSCDRNAIIQSANMHIKADTWVPLYGNGKAAAEMIHVISEQFFLPGKSFSPANHISDAVYK
jgi:UDP-N-acetylglucosamine 2-epimerase